MRRQGKISEAYQVCLDLQDPANRELELQGLMEAMQIHGLVSGVIITEDQEEKLEIQFNGLTASVAILPAWKGLLSG